MRGAHVQEVLVYFSEGILSENGASVMGQSSAVQMAWSYMPWAGDDGCRRRVFPIECHGQELAHRGHVCRESVYDIS